MGRALISVAKAGVTLPTGQIGTVSPAPPWFDLESLTEEIFAAAPKRFSQNKETQERFQALAMDKYPGRTRIFTDGSVRQGGRSTTAAIFVEEKNICSTWNLSGGVPIITAELFAISQAMIFIARNCIVNSVIFTDSQSALLLVANRKPPSNRALVYNIQQAICDLTSKGYKTGIQFIPSHKGILGNEVADKAAGMTHGAEVTYALPPDPKHSSQSPGSGLLPLGRRHVWTSGMLTTSVRGHDP